MPAPASAVRRVARNSLSPFAANLLGRVLAWGMAVVMARQLGPSGTGAYALVVNMWLYASILADFGLGTWLTREVARAPAEARQAVGATLGIRLLLSFAAVPVLIGVSALYAAMGADREIVPTAALLGLGLLPGAVSGAGTALFNAHEEMVFPAALQLASAGLTTFAGAAVLLAGHGIVALGWVSLAVNLLSATAFGLASARRYFGLRPVVDGRRQLAIVRDALPLMLNSLLNNVFFRADVQVLQAKGSAVVGYYSNAYKVLDAAGAVPSSFVLALFPAMSRRAAVPGDEGHSGLTRVYRLALTLLVSLALPIALVVSFLADDLTRWFWGEAFLPHSAIALRVLIWFLPLSFFNGLTQYVLIALGLQHRITPAFALAAAFNLGANLLLIPRYSYIAAAAITIASEVVLLVPFLASLRGRIDVRTIVFAALRPVPAVMGMAVVLYTLSQWTLAGGVLGASLAYMGLFVVTRTLSGDEWRLISDLLPARYRSRISRAAR